MPTVDVLVETVVSRSIRARQVQSVFDVPEREREEKSWHLEMPIEAKPWRVGLIVGPSGSGKSTVMRKVFGEERRLEWKQASVIDDFAEGLGISDITNACSAVGFNTIPAWLRPFHVLSNGEKFRVELARRLLEEPGPIVVDEFTSLVDRQVAKVASHAAQKYARKIGKQLVAVTCHYDVEDWLQPDWVLDVASGEFKWRELQRRPTVDIEIRRVPYKTWQLFAPFHYLTKDLNPAARSFAAFVDGRPVAFAAVIQQPHPKVRDIHRVSRLVTLPDWQGLGVALALVDRLGAAQKAVGRRLRTYPAHRGLVQSFGRSPQWNQLKKFGTFSPSSEGNSATVKAKAFGGRPCAVFEYVGDAWPDKLEAAAMILGEK